MVAKDWDAVMKKAKKPKQPAEDAPWIEWQNYLLLMLLGGHVDCPPRRDNWGTMKIIDNRSEVKKKTGVNATMDYYIRKSKEFLFRSMKPRADFEDREIYQKCPDSIAAVIEASLTAHRRHQAGHRTAQYCQPSALSAQFVSSRAKTGQGKADFVALLARNGRLQVHPTTPRA